MTHAPAHVRRWHTHPVLGATGDTVEAHGRRVCALVMQMAAAAGLPLEGSDLPLAALHHDDAEAVIGDIPAPAKARFPGLRAAYEAAEAEVMAELGLRWRLGEEERELLALADAADAWAWAHRHGCGGDPEFREARAQLVGRAAAHSTSLADWVRRWIAGVEAGHQ